MAHEQDLHVLVATPLGEGGKGGIDRIMDNVRLELTKNPVEGTIVYFGVTRGPGLIAVSPLYFLVFCIRMAWLRLLGRCDVVHLNIASRGSTCRKLIIGRLAELLGISYVAHLHGAEYREFLSGVSPSLQARIRRFYAEAEKVIVLGRVWGEFVADQMGVGREKVVILPNAVHAPHSAPRKELQGGVRILFLGELGERKGVPQLVTALARCSTHASWKAVIAGNGDAESVRTSVESFGLSDRVSVPGWVGSNETERLLRESDVLVLPSHAENLPMSVIEGMAAGLAVITTPVGAVPDIIQHGRTGLLVPPGDVAALGHALERVIDSPELRAQLGNAARDFHRRNLEVGPYVRTLVRIWKEAAE